MEQFFIPWCPKCGEFLHPGKCEEKRTIFLYCYKCKKVVRKKVFTKKTWDIMSQPMDLDFNKPKKYHLYQHTTNKNIDPKWTKGKDGYYLEKTLKD